MHFTERASSGTLHCVLKHVRMSLNIFPSRFYLSFSVILTPTPFQLMRMLPPSLTWGTIPRPCLPSPYPIPRCHHYVFQSRFFSGFSQLLIFIRCLLTRTKGNSVKSYILQCHPRIHFYGVTLLHRKWSTLVLHLLQHQGKSSSHPAPHTSHQWPNSALWHS